MSILTSAAPTTAADLSLLPKLTTDSVVRLCEGRSAGPVTERGKLRCLATSAGRAVC